MALQQGSVIWAEVTDRRGLDPKVRPLVVITKNSEIATNELIAAVAVSTRFSKPPEDYEVPLPWSPGRHPLTGLYVECVAVCNWIESVSQAKIQAFKGPISVRMMMQIIEKVNNYVPGSI